MGLELLKVDFEVLLATDPVLMVLSHFQRVFNRRERFNGQLVDKVSFLEILSQVQTQDRHWFIL